jgi:hypothetical protein
MRLHDLRQQLTQRQRDIVERRDIGESVAMGS